MQHQPVQMASQPWAPANQGELVMLLSHGAVMVPPPQYLIAKVLAVVWDESVHVMCLLLHLQV
jgi:hypothetical protein